MAYLLLLSVGACGRVDYDLLVIKSPDTSVVVDAGIRDNGPRRRTDVGDGGFALPPPMDMEGADRAPDRPAAMSPNVSPDLNFRPMPDVFVHPEDVQPDVVSPLDQRPDVTASVDAARGIPTQSLVAHYRFDEGQGNSTQDSSGRGNHGVLVGGPTWTMGRTGGALQFTAEVARRVEIPGSRSLDDLGPAFTLAAWIWTYGSGWQQTIASRLSSQTKNYAFSFLFFQDELGFDGVNGQVFRHKIEGFSNMRWYHVAARYDGTSVTLYLDGVVLGTRPIEVGMTDPTQPVMIGAVREGDNVFSSWNGRLDDVMIYDRALSPDEIAGLAR